MDTNTEAMKTVDLTDVHTPAPMLTTRTARSDDTLIDAYQLVLERAAAAEYELKHQRALFALQTDHVTTLLRDLNQTQARADDLQIQLRVERGQLENLYELVLRMVAAEKGAR